jgi:hypothetical protein
MKKNTTLKAKAYRLKNGNSPLAYMLSSRHSRRSPLLYFDEEKGINRPLRYARNQKTPFEDDQDGNAILEPVVFEDGMLYVPRENQVLQQFLHYHPSNGSLFEEIDEAKDAQEELISVELEVDALVMARELEVDKLLSVCRVLMGNHVDKLTIPQLKRDILIYAKSNPEDFIDTVNDPMLELQDEVRRFMVNGYLIFKNSKKDIYFNLPGNKKKLLTIPFGEDPEYTLAAYMQSDGGLEIYKHLSNRLKKDK